MFRGGGGTTYNGPHGKDPPERVNFFIKCREICHLVIWEGFVKPEDASEARFPDAITV